nr:MAG TPA: hypothetical protein [Microviridae sp.]
MTYTEESARRAFTRSYMLCARPLLGGVRETERKKAMNA